MAGLHEYAKTRALLTLGDAQEELDKQRASLRLLDANIAGLLLKKHKLKNVQICKDVSVRIESNLVDIFDWLEDKIQETASINQNDAAQKLLKQCEQLMARSERIKKTISDDMAACRYAESKGVLNPGQALGVIVAATGGTAIFFKTFLTSRLDVAVDAGGVAAVVSTYGSFHRQINRGCAAAAKVVAQSPRCIRAWGRNARFPIAAAVITASVATKQVSEIRPRHPSLNTIGPIVVVSAKL